MIAPPIEDYSPYDEPTSFTDVVVSQSAPQPTVDPVEIISQPLPMVTQPTNTMLNSDIPYFTDASQSGGGSSYAPMDYVNYITAGGGGVIAAPNSEPAPSGTVLDQILAQTQQNTGNTAQTNTTQNQNTVTPAIALTDSPIVTWIKNNKLIVGAGIALVAWLLLSGSGSRTVRVIRGQ